MIFSCLHGQYPHFYQCDSHLSRIHNQKKLREVYCSDLKGVKSGLPHCAAYIGEGAVPQEFSFEDILVKGKPESFNSGSFDKQKPNAGVIGLLRQNF